MSKSKGPKVEFVAALLLVVLFSVLAFPGASAVKKPAAQLQSSTLPIAQVN